MISVAIVTPSIGLPFLEKNLISVKNQTYRSIKHHIFVDGTENLPKISEIVHKIGVKDQISLNIIDENIGKGWYGHRVYASCSFLVNQDIIIYLDEDNWLEPNHVESMVDTISKGNDWAFCLRKIFDKEGNYICDDDCESLGKWPVFFDEKVFLVDTSCYAVKKDVALRIGHAWYGKWGADRQFFSALRQYFPNFSCTGKYTLCYRLGGNDDSVKQEFFITGNENQIKKYSSKENFPWSKTQQKIGPGISIQM